MRIAMFMDSWIPMSGGGPLHVVQLVKELAARGHKVDIFTRKLFWDGESHTEDYWITKDSVRVHRIGLKTGFFNSIGRVSYLFMATLRGVFGSYDIYHGHAYVGGIPARISAFLRRKKDVFTVHGTGLQNWQKRSRVASLYEWLERFLLYGIPYAHVISVSKSVANTVRKKGRKATFIPNGVDIKQFHASTAKKKYDAIFVGRLHAQKDPETMIKTVAEIVKRKKDFSLAIVGEGTLLGMSRALVAELGIAQNVHFLGRQPFEKIPQLYRQSRLMLLTSLFEGMPLTILEALATEIAVVATKVEGTQELDGIFDNLILTPAQQPKRIAAAVLATLKKRHTFKKDMETIHKRYSWTSVAEKTENIYKSL